MTVITLKRSTTVLVAILVLLFAYLLLFTAATHGYEYWDDTGDYILTLRQFNSGLHLYSDIYAPYGPLYYASQLALFHLLHLPLTPNGAAVLTAAEATLLTGMAGLAVLRIFKKTMPALLTIICCSVSLMLLSHGILYAGLLLAVLSLAIVMLMLLGSPRTFPVRDACIGLLLTGALLIKINVGILCCLAVASVVTFQALSPGSNKAVRVLGYALSILLAIAISFITVLQSRTFIGWSLIELAAAGALLLTLAHQIRNHATAHAHNIATRAAYTAAGGVVGLAAVLALLIAHGERVSTLLKGILFIPLHQSSYFTFPIHVGGYGAFIACVLAVLSFGSLSKQVRRSPLFPLLLAGITAAFLYMSCISHTDALLFTPAYALFARTYTRNTSPKYRQAKLCLAIFGFWLQLQAFPVPGFVVILALLPLDVLAVLTLCELVLHYHTSSSKSHRLVAVSLSAGYAILLAFAVIEQTVALQQFSTRLILPGSNSYYETSSAALQYEETVAALGQHCASFVTIPGMESFYLWTGLQPPYSKLIAEWPYGFSTSTQNQLLHALREESTQCVLVGQTQLAFWRAGRPLPNSPLVTFMLNQHAELFHTENFTLYRVHTWPKELAPSA